MSDRREYRGVKIGGNIHYGQHVMITAYGCGDRIRDISAMKTFLTDLVEKIDMVAFKDPMVYRFGEGIEVGLSGAQFIETSLISFHTNDQSGDFYLDVFSCKEFCANTIEEYIQQYFQPEAQKTTQIWRD